MQLLFERVQRTAALLIFGNKVEGSELQGAQGRFRALAGQGTDHKHRFGCGLHEAFQHAQAVQPGHLHIQGDQVRIEFFHLFQTVFPVAGGAHHFDVRIFGKHPGQGAAHEGGIIHDKYFYHAEGLRGAWGRPRRSAVSESSSSKTHLVYVSIIILTTSQKSACHPSGKRVRCISRYGMWLSLARAQRSGR